MSLIYTKSALKQIKKDDLIDFYLSQQQKMSQLWVEMGHLCNEEDAKEHWGLVDGNELEQAKKEIKQLKEQINDWEEEVSDTQSASESLEWNLKEEIKKLKEQNDRMSRYIESREVKYCEKCEEYGELTDDPENCDGIFQNQKGNFICTDCHEDLPDVCCDCDKPINTQDEETSCADAPKLYKEYYGSELDNGDICYECILHHK